MQFKCSDNYLFNNYYVFFLINKNYIFYLIDILNHYKLVNYFNLNTNKKFIDIN